jgi:hypothetical protein
MNGALVVRCFLPWSLAESPSWSLCHARSYQNAYGSHVNRFKSRAAAESFARSRGHEIETHDFDWMQSEKIAAAYWAEVQAQALRAYLVDHEGAKLWAHPDTGNLYAHKIGAATWGAGAVLWPDLAR